MRYHGKILYTKNKKWLENTVRLSQNISYRYMLNDDKMRSSFVALNITIFFCKGKKRFLVDLLWVERFLKGLSGSRSRFCRDVK